MVRLLDNTPPNIQWCTEARDDVLSVIVSRVVAVVLVDEYRLYSSTEDIMIYINAIYYNV